MGCLSIVALIISALFLGVSDTVVEPPQAMASPPQLIENQYAGIPRDRTDDGAFILGFKEAPITLVAFEDFLCPHCQSYQTTIHQVIEEFVATGMARLEYRFTPAVHPTYSVLAAKFAECADTLNPGIFWVAHDKMFELASKERFSDSTLQKFATSMNLSIESLQACAAEAMQVEIDGKYASESGVRGTPTVMVYYGDGEIENPFGGAPNIEALRELINAAQN